MNGNLKYYRMLEVIADAFRYPGELTKERIGKIYDYLSDNSPKAAKAFLPFKEFVDKTDLKLWEEIYTRSFDVQAITTLDLGYVLFGDDYKRGELLVNLNNEHNKAGNSCGKELPDHLPNVLRLLPKLKDENLRRDLIKLLVKPAVTKIYSEFAVDHIEKKSNIYIKHHNTLIEHDSVHRLIYREPIATVLVIIDEFFEEDAGDIAVNKSFTSEINNELEIENLG